MFSSFPPAHPAGNGGPARIPRLVGTQVGHWRSLLVQAERACCCPGPPTVVVLLPPGPGRPGEVDLLLCRHHYRVSRKTLDVIGAAIFDPDDAPPDPEEPEAPAEPAAAAGR
jgi:hypothetical protein